MELTITSDLLLDLAERFASLPLLVIGGEAALANAFDADPTFQPTDIRERDNARVSVIDSPNPASFATGLLPAPPDRDLLRRHLLTAATALQPDGLLIIAGANAEGGKTAIKDAEELFGAPTWSGYREKHRLAMFRKTTLLTPAWSMVAGIAPGTWQGFLIDTPVGPLELQTQAGVFAGNKLDAGTRLLLENMSIPAGANVLDLGCGAGIIGLTAARMGAGAITMTDANLLAVETARHNIDRLGIAATVIASDVLAQLDGQRFDCILSNPPFHRGKKVDLRVANRLIAEASAHLTPGGSLVIVANAFLAYDKHMREAFPHVEIIAKTPQFHVMRGTR